MFGKGLFLLVVVVMSSSSLSQFENVRFLFGGLNSFDDCGGCGGVVHSILFWSFFLFYLVGKKGSDVGLFGLLEGGRNKFYFFFNFFLFHSHTSSIN